MPSGDYKWKWSHLIYNELHSEGNWWNVVLSNNDNDIDYSDDEYDQWDDDDADYSDDDDDEDSDDDDADYSDDDTDYNDDDDDNDEDSDDDGDEAVMTMTILSICRSKILTGKATLPWEIGQSF